jgi:hypothetical protein
MMIRFGIILLIVLFNFSIQAQKNNLRFNIVPVFYGESLKLNKEYISKDSVVITKVETLKFYLSNIKIIRNDKIVFVEKKSQRLLDMENQQTFIFDVKYPNIRFDKISFCIGLDSLTNVSGALAGDLDPTNGMYWTWQSGYINFKLEGYSNKSKGRNGKFQYHLGGYQDPFNCLQELTYPLIDQSELKLELAIDKFLSFVNLELDSEIMSPGKKAVLLSEKFKEIFTIRK